MERSSRPDFERADFERLLDGLRGELVLKQIPAGALIYSQGDTCRAIAFVMEGGIRVYKTGENGREITLYDLGPGETCILNASAILSGEEYPANAVTSENTKVALLDAGRFRQLMAASAPGETNLREFMFSLLSRRLGAVMALVEEVAFGRMDERLIEYLKGKSSGGSLEKGGPEIGGEETGFLLNTTHQRIANDLGTSREVVSRLLKDFERKGILEVHRNAIRLFPAVRQKNKRFPIDERPGG